MKTYKAIYLNLVYLLLYLPIAIVVTFSFNTSPKSLLWHGFSTKWYQILFHDNAIFSVTLHSLTISTIAATMAAILGTIAAINLFRYRFYGKKLIHGLLFILVIAPDIILAIALLTLYNVLHFPLGFWSLLLAHITLCLPFVAITVYSRVVTLDKDIFVAARDLGANDFVIFKRIVIPLLLPAIIAGWLLSFTLSLDDVIISYFVSGPGYEILPLKIYSMVRMGVKPEVNALCTIMLVATLFIVLIAQYLLKQNHEKNNSAAVN
ncbi:MAG: spermidine/putrescine ABC transporter permease PotC [Gammaproteobacteria bacterium]|nr:spermidine/putrescine ABC transporter permease PotC [Gammaproteobacteria bacterium]